MRVPSEQHIMLIGIHQGLLSQATELPLADRMAADPLAGIAKKRIDNLRDRPLSSHGGRLLLLLVVGCAELLCFLELDVQAIQQPAALLLLVQAPDQHTLPACPRSRELRHAQPLASAEAIPAPLRPLPLPLRILHMRERLLANM